MGTLHEMTALYLRGRVPAVPTHRSVPIWDLTFATKQNKTPHLAVSITCSRTRQSRTHGSCKSWCAVWADVEATRAWGYGFPLAQSSCPLTKAHWDPTSAILGAPPGTPSPASLQRLSLLPLARACESANGREKPAPAAQAAREAPGNQHSHPTSKGFAIPNFPATVPKLFAFPKT